MFLQSQLYGEALDICLKMSSEDIKAADGAMKSVHAIHKSHSLAVFNDTFQNFQDLFLNAVCKDSQLPESSASFLASDHANIDSSKRMSILASVLRKSFSSTSASSFENITYADFSSLIRV